MNNLWAPWRIDYVSGINNKKKGCIFCFLNKDKNDDKNYIVLRSSHCFVMFNKFPYNNGHLMVIPYRHIYSIEKLIDSEIMDMNKTLIKMHTILKKVIKPDGFNLGMNIGKLAGAGIDKHLHIHLVPRWLGDTNFMPVVSDTKVISQSLEELYKQMKKNVTPH